MEKQIALIFVALISYIGQYFLIWLFIPAILIVVACKLSKVRNAKSLATFTSICFILWLVVGIGGFGACFAVLDEAAKEPDPPDGAALGCIFIFFLWGVIWLSSLVTSSIALFLLHLKIEKKWLPPTPLLR